MTSRGTALSWQFLYSLLVSSLLFLEFNMMTFLAHISMTHNTISNCCTRLFHFRFSKVTAWLLTPLPDPPCICISRHICGILCHSNACVACGCLVPGVLTLISRHSNDMKELSLQAEEAMSHKCDAPVGWQIMKSMTSKRTASVNIVGTLPHYYGRGRHTAENQYKRALSAQTGDRQCWG